MKPQEEEKKGGEAVVPEKLKYEEMTEEQKNQNMKLSLSNLINQMEPRIQSTEDRRNIDRLKQLLPLYDKHAFWDTQPVPKNLNATKQVTKNTIYQHYRKMRRMERSSTSHLVTSKRPHISCLRVSSGAP